MAMTADVGVVGASDSQASVLLRSDTDALLVDALLGTRVMGMDSQFYRGLRRRLHDVMGETGALVILYEMGVGYGESIGTSIRRHGSDKLVQSFVERVKAFGMGSLKMPLKEMKAKMRGEPMVEVQQSFFAASMGYTGQTECYVFAGIIAGIAGALLNSSLRCIEEKCVSRGDDVCAFRLEEILQGEETVPVDGPPGPRSETK